MSLSPEPAEHGMAPTVLEVVQSLPVSSGAPEVLAEKALLTPTPCTVVAMFPRFHKSCYCLPLGYLHWGALNDSLAILSSSYRDRIKWIWEDREKINMRTSLFQTCVLKHLM